MDMARLAIIMLATITLMISGCGSSTTNRGDASKLITWEQYQKLPPEDQGDPYILNNLDPTAQQKLRIPPRKQGR